MTCPISASFNLNYPGAISTAFGNAYVPREWLRENDTTPPVPPDGGLRSRANAFFSGFDSVTSGHSDIAGTAGVDARQSFIDFVAHVAASSGLGAVAVPNSAEGTATQFVDTVNARNAAAAQAAQAKAVASAAANAAAQAAPTGAPPAIVATAPAQAVIATPNVAPGSTSTGATLNTSASTSASRGPGYSSFTQPKTVADALNAQDDAASAAPATKPFSIVPLLLLLASFWSGS